MAKTVYGEARGEGEEGMLAVAHVILNRLDKQDWMGKTIAEVCLKPYQFSIWNEDSRHLLDKANLETYNRLRQAMRLSLEAMEHRSDDPTQGATHYHRKDITPAWAQGKVPIYTWRNHYFYTGIN